MGAHHPNADRYLNAVPDPDVRAQLQVFFSAFDAMDRENAFLRLKLQASGCPYGHANPTAGCELGYPGCACMDDVMAMATWSPEDEDKAAARIGRRLAAAEAALDALRQTAVGIALSLATKGDKTTARLLTRAVAAASVQVTA